MSVIVVATIRPLVEHRAAVVAALKEAIPAVHAEPGCALYALTEMPDRLVMVEQWDSAERLAEHARGDAFGALNAFTEDKLEVPFEVLVLAPVPAGDPGKGQLRT